MNCGRVHARTEAIILNSPNNPTGKVFTREELDVIAALCQECDAVVFTDEIYEHILYDGAVHVRSRRSPGMERSNGHDQRAVEDLRGDRLAGRMGDGAGAALSRHP